MLQLTAAGSSKPPPPGALPPPDHPDVACVAAEVLQVCCCNAAARAAQVCQQLLEVVLNCRHVSVSLLAVQPLQLQVQTASRRSTAMRHGGDTCALVTTAAGKQHCSSDTMSTVMDAFHSKLRTSSGSMVTSRCPAGMHSVWSAWQYKQTDRCHATFKPTAVAASKGPGTL